MKIGIVGAGTIATEVCKKLCSSGVSIIQVYNRTFSKAKILAESVGAKAINDIVEFSLDLDIILIMVSDDAIKKVASSLNPNRLKKYPSIAHTSGSKSSSKLIAADTDYGVFYPLQTFKNIKASDWDSIPILICGSNKFVENKLINLAKLINCDYHIKTDQQRAALHLSAVVVNNFMNHLFCLNTEFVEKHQSNFDLLVPLIQKTFQNVVESNACDLQTGPAKRGDNLVIDKHINALSEFPQLQKLYKVFSESIKESYNN